MWRINTKGEKEFGGGKTAWKEAASTAAACEHFKEDDEDECVAEEQVSCYNCRYRRWTQEGFICMKTVQR